MTEVKEYYHTIEILPLYNWDRYLATKDFNWFIKGFDGRQAKIENEYLVELESNIQDEYFEAINDHVFRNKITKWDRINKLKSKYIACSSVIDRMWLGFAESQIETRYLFIRLLKGFGYKMPEINTVGGDGFELQRIHNALQGILTQIAILELELKEDAVKERTNLNKQLLIMEMSLNLGRKINPKKTTVSEWIEMGKLIEERAKQN